MTIVKSACPDCGDVDDLQGEDIVLVLCPQRPELARYSFVCTMCTNLVEHPAPRKVIDLLNQARGVTREYRRLPQEALEEHTGPLLTLDDLLDLGLALERSDLLLVDLE